MLDELLLGDGWARCCDGRHRLLCLQVSQDSPQYWGSIILKITRIEFSFASFLYGNIHAGLWALGSGILAAIVLHLHLLFLNHRCVHCTLYRCVHLQLHPLHCTSYFHQFPPLFRLPTWHTVHSLAANRNLGLLTLAFRFILLTLYPNQHNKLLFWSSSIGATVYYIYTAISEHQQVYPIEDRWVAPLHNHIKWRLIILTSYAQLYDCWGLVLYGSQVVSWPGDIWP